MQDTPECFVLSDTEELYFELLIEEDNHSFNKPVVQISHYYKSKNAWTTGDFPKDISIRILTTNEIVENEDDCFRFTPKRNCLYDLYRDNKLITRFSVFIPPTQIFTFSSSLTQ